MGYAHERGAAARNLLRARAHGNEDVIADAETLAWTWLGDDYGEDGDDAMEEYIADHYADFTPEPPVITDDMVERAAGVIWAGTHVARKPETLPSAADTLRGGDWYRRNARAALVAALNPKENEA